MTKMAPETPSIFQENIHRYGAAYLGFKKRDTFFTWVRVFVFLFSAILTSYFLFIGSAQVGLMVLSAGIVAFGIVVNIHRRVKFELRQKQFLQQINQEEILRLQGQLSGFIPGSDFTDIEHDYSADLDLFGRNSLFQLLNRTTTPTGQQTMADWLSTAADPEVIRERQLAVAEISSRPDWNQYFIALPRHKDHEIEGREYALFWNWMKASSGRNLQKWQWVALFLGAINLGFLVAVLVSALSWIYLSIPMVIGLMAIRNLQQEMARSMEISRIGLHLMESYLLMMDWLKTESWETGLIKRLLQRLDEPVKASSEIKKLKQMLHTLAGRANPFFALFNIFFAVDIHLMVRLEKWKQLNGQHFPGWMAALGELEALSGLSAYAHANPAYIMPRVIEGEAHLETTGLGHPLIPATVRVTNHFSIKHRGAVGVITGSNMSGKSTFLRTIGINMVLAQMGAPVCAETFSMSPLTLFSSMRTSDNLEESVSSFYAELRRIERLIKAIGTGNPVFFILDEILKGTNTHDRQLGARSLIKQLSQGNAMGLVSTHDISLGELAESVQAVTNWHFSSQVKEGNLLFDYQLRDGVCQSFNASELMAQIGIQLEQDQG